MAQAAESSSEYQGSFGFETLLCQLFRQIDPLVELDRERAVDTVALTRMAEAARRMSDVFMPRWLTDEVREATREVLFHERVHYWQVLSASAMQRHIANSLAHLQLAIELNGGEQMAVWGGGKIDPEGTVKNAKFLYENFNWAGLRVHWRYESVAIGTNPASSITRVLFGIDLNTLIEGYVGELGGVEVPLVGRYLLESAAYVSEQLFKGEEVARLSGPATTEDVTYRGAWELWARANASVYDDPRLLALSFLAAVDLAVNPELPATPTDAPQRITIPWRFGVLLQAAPKLPPLRVADRTPAEAVAEFQNMYSDALGWPSPAKIALQLAAYLVRFYAPIFAMSDQADRVLAFCHRPLEEITLDEMTPILQLINRGGELDVLGLSVLRSAINAAIHRLFNPGQFALPHLYVDELRKSFPLPAILYQGDLYIENMPEGAVLNVQPIDYWSDCVRLMTIDHLRSTPRSEALTCGFVRRNAECSYMAAGAGCPKRGLSASEVGARKNAGLDADWCHWKLNAMVVGLLPPDASKTEAPAVMQASRAGWYSVSSPEDVEKLVRVHEQLWLTMSQEDRQKALAGSAEIRKGLSDEERANFVDMWALVANRV